MTRGALFVVDGFVEEQVTYARYRLREDGVVVEFATPTGEPANGERGMTVEDTLGAQYDTTGADLDFLVVPGTVGEFDLSPAVESWLADRLRASSVFACIGSGVGVLVRLDALGDRLVTAPESIADAVERAGGRLTGERVTVDGTLVTGRGTDVLPFFLVAVRNALAIPQDPDAVVRHRPYQERAAWNAGRTN